MATQQVSVTKHSFPPQFSVSLNSLFFVKKPCFIHSQQTHITQIHAHHCSFNQNLFKGKKHQQNN